MLIRRKCFQGSFICSRRSSLNSLEKCRRRSPVWENAASTCQQYTGLVALLLSRQCTKTWSSHLRTGHRTSRSNPSSPKTILKISTSTRLWRSKGSARCARPRRHFKRLGRRSSSSYLPRRTSCSRVETSASGNSSQATSRGLLKSKPTSSWLSD